MVPPIVIPDTQGEAGLLIDLLEQIFDKNLLKNRQLVFLGDYMNRGEDTKKLLDECIELKKNGHVFIRGNHEDVLIRAYLADIQGDNFFRDLLIYQWLKMESNTLLSYGISRHSKNNLRIFEEFIHKLKELKHLDFLLELLPYYETGNLILIHAGVKDNEEWEFQKKDIDSKIFSYKHELEQIYSFELANSFSHNLSGKCVVSGHSPRELPYISESRAMLDCGSGRPGRPLIGWVSDTDEVLYSFKQKTF